MARKNRLPPPRPYSYALDVWTDLAGLMDAAERMAKTLDSSPEPGTYPAEFEQMLVALRVWVPHVAQALAKADAEMTQLIESHDVILSI